MHMWISPHQVIVLLVFTLSPGLLAEWVLLCLFPNHIFPSAVCFVPNLVCSGSLTQQNVRGLVCCGRTVGFSQFLVLIA